MQNGELIDIDEEKLTSACAAAFRAGYKDGFRDGYAAAKEPQPLVAGCKGCGGPVEDGFTVCDECCESVKPQPQPVREAETND